MVAAWLLLLAGCPRPESTAPPEPPGPPRAAPPLKLLVLDDPGLAAAIERQWRARADTEIQILQTTSSELVASAPRSLAADAVIYPSGMLGELVVRELIVAMPRSEVNGEAFARRDIFDLIRQREIAWGTQVFAVPLGSPTLTLMYRRDLFDKLSLAVPETWEQYARMAEQLADRQTLGDLGPAAGEPWAAVAEPLGDGWASQVLLARAAVYARHRNYFSALFDANTMAPLIGGPPFVRALEELVAAQRFAPANGLELAPAEARDELLAGRCAMCLAWPSLDADKADSAAATVMPLGVAELPGSRQVYDPDDRQWQPREGSDEGRVPLLGVAGRLGSVTSASRQPRAALNLLLNVSSTQWSDQVSPYSPATTLYRSSQLGQAEAWMGPVWDPTAVRAYAELVDRTQSRPLWLFSLRMPGRQQYLEALDQAVRQAVRGEASASETLAKAAERWAAITEELGVEQQRAAYWRSQGMEP